MGETMILAENIHKSYQVGESEVSIIKGVSFEIKEGEMVALIGPSGSGKTTLLNILGLIVEPDSGSLRLGEHVMNDKQQGRDELRSSFIGSIFQQFYLLPQFNAIKNVCIPMVPKKKKFNVEERAAQLLSQVGLEHRMGHLPSELSGGEQQRVAIARALINFPKVLLCDEPTGNLDSQTRDSIIELLLSLKKEGLTIVIATHDPEVAYRCDYSLTIRDGKLSKSKSN